MSDEHALLSASSSSRWLACTPSVRLAEKYEDRTSEAAEEGTAAHSMAENKLLKALGLKAPRRAKTKYDDADMGLHSDDYVAYVQELMCDTSHVLVEARLDYSRWVPEGFGTGDAVVVSPNRLDIVDLKYGKGVEVDAENNSQMMLYALGALEYFDGIYDFEEVCMHIFQPRRNNLCSWTITPAELYAWADEYVVPRARLAYAGEGEQVSGDHCRFCPVRNRCRKLAEDNLALAEYEFREAHELTNPEIADILSRTSKLVSWAESINKYALEEARDHGANFPGYKLVAGRSNRKYTDEDAVAEALREAGHKRNIFQPRKLVSLGALERKLGKAHFEEVLGDLIIKPEGKPTLVPVEDKRPQLNTSAENDFERID